jgi:hypothetical protein
MEKASPPPPRAGYSVGGIASEILGLSENLASAIRPQVVYTKRNAAVMQRDGTLRYTRGPRPPLHHSPTKDPIALVFC